MNNTDKFGYPRELPDWDGSQQTEAPITTKKQTEWFPIIALCVAIVIPILFGTCGDRSDPGIAPGFHSS